MAPVGSWESLYAAQQGGADAIYFGIEGLNMRSRSSVNFTLEDLHTIAQWCHEHGMKSYLTVNTIIVHLLFSLVALPGLEPGNAAPKTVVLPLHYKAIPMSTERQALKLRCKITAFF